MRWTRQRPWNSRQKSVVLWEVDLYTNISFPSGKLLPVMLIFVVVVQKEKTGGFCCALE